MNDKWLNALKTYIDTRAEEEGHLQGRASYLNSVEQIIAIREKTSKAWDAFVKTNEEVKASCRDLHGGV